MFNLASFLTYIIVSTYTPGPNNITAMSIGSSGGFRKAMIFCVGMFLGAVTLIGTGMALSKTLYTLIPKIKLPIMIFGSMYMLYLAYKILKSSSVEKNKIQSNSSLFLTGVTLQFINPKAIVFSITTTSVYIAPYFEKFSTISLFVLLLAFIGFTGVVIWAAFGSVFYKLFSSKYQKAINIVMAFLLVYCAVSLFL